VSQGVRGNALVKASERLPKERLERFVVNAIRQQTSIPCATFWVLNRIGQGQPILSTLCPRRSVFPDHEEPERAFSAIC
jgi:hypothetical protein